MAIFKCKFCGSEFSRPDAEVRYRRKIKQPIRYCSIKCRARSNPKGRRKDIVAGGYRYVTTSDGRVIGEHRAKMEKKLGRKLKRFEFVHHKDHDRGNNALRNLELMTVKQHQLHHMGEKLRFDPDKAKQLRQQGLSFAAIGNRLGASGKSIWYALVHRGLHIPTHRV